MTIQLNGVTKSLKKLEIDGKMEFSTFFSKMKNKNKNKIEFAHRNAFWSSKSVLLLKNKRQQFEQPSACYSVPNFLLNRFRGLQIAIPFLSKTHKIKSVSFLVQCESTSLASILSVAILFVWSDCSFKRSFSQTKMLLQPYVFPILKFVFLEICLVGINFR